MLDQTDFLALITTLKLALIATLILLLVCIPLAWWLSRSQWRFRHWIHALVSLPLVMPPTVLGFYLLVLFSPNNWLGAALVSLSGETLAFSFSGLVIGSILYSLPFVVQPLFAAFSLVQKELLEAAATLGADPRDQFRSVVIPMAKPGILVAAILGFAHTIGEFGIVLMIGGNIVGETQVLSIAIYEHVEALDYAKAHLLAAGLLLFSFVSLVLVYRTNQRAVLPWVN